MSGNKLLIDSNIIIYLSKKELILDSFVRHADSLHISVITLMEVKGFAYTSKKEERFVDKLCDLFLLEHIHDEIIQQVIKIRKSFRIKLPDAIILATALVNDFTLVTHNTADFKDLKDNSGFKFRLIDPII